MIPRLATMEITVEFCIDCPYLGKNSHVCRAKMQRVTSPTSKIPDFCPYRNDWTPGI